MNTVTGLMLSCLGTATLLCKHVKYVCGAGSMIVFSNAITSLAVGAAPSEKLFSGEASVQSVHTITPQTLGRLSLHMPSEI